LKLVISLLAMSLFQNKYRIGSTRLPEYDYSNPGWYYVTICTKNKEGFFGEVKNDKMILNELGIIVEREWLKTKEIRKNVELDYYVIMPNHIHGIIILDDNVETRRGVSLQLKFKNKFSNPIKNSLSIIINQFKGSVKRWCNKNGFSYFHWQPRFHEHIIRNDKSLYEIRKYMINNPLKWSIDLENPNRN